MNAAEQERQLDLKIEAFKAEIRLQPTGVKNSFTMVDKFGNDWAVWANYTEGEKPRIREWIGVLRNDLESRDWKQPTKKYLIDLMATSAVTHFEIFAQRVTEAKPFDTPLSKPKEFLEAMLELDRVKDVTEQALQILAPESTARALAAYDEDGYKIRQGRRFTEDEIRDIRTRVAEGQKISAMAHKYHCSAMFIRNVIKRRVYKDVK